MDIKKFRQYFGNFDMEKENIEKFLEGKKIFEKNNHFYLIQKDKNFSSNQVFSNNLMFINLKGNLLPSTYLLNFLKNATKPIRMKTSKQAVNFTYGKNLHLDSIIKRRDFMENKHYVLTSENDILGIVKIDYSQRFAVLNIMNIGEYLREN